MEEVVMSEEPVDPVAVRERQAAEADDAAFSAPDPLEHHYESGGPLDAQHASSTGDFRVDSALSRLEELAGVPVAEHVDVYDDVHAQLRAALADLDER